MSPANANDSHLRSELPGVVMALRTIAQRLRMRRRARLRTWRHAEGWAQAGRAGNADPVQRICPSNQPTLVANSELSAYSWARRFAQPAPTRKFSLTMGAKRGVLVGPANSPPVSLLGLPPEAAPRSFRPSPRRTIPSWSEPVQSGFSTICRAVGGRPSRASRRGQGGAEGRPRKSAVRAAVLG